MIIRSRGVVLSHINYKETSIICKIYTEELGIQSFIVHGVRTKKNSSNTAFLQPLTLMELEIYYKTKSKLHLIKEHRIVNPFHSIPFNQSKRAITFFLTEALEKSLNEEQANHDMFIFMTNSIELFDSLNENVENFHLFFLFFLTKFLGFYPHPAENDKEIYFDMIEGKYCSRIPMHQHYLNPDEAQLWMQVSKQGADLLSGYKFERTARQTIIDKLLEYYTLHIPAFGNLNSLKILQQLFDY